MNKKRTSTIRRVNDWVHLWFGLVSGIIVFIVSITGCFYAFQQEIKDAMEPWRFVEAQDRDFVPPGVLLDTASKYMPGAKPTGLTYSDREGAAAVGYNTMDNGKRGFSVIFLNPYTGAFLKKEQTLGGEAPFNFFRFIIDGHRALWLPYPIGRPIVGVATLVFIILLVTGLVMWWPKNWKKSNVDKSFKIRWRAGFKRVNYDLHNVVGFYSLLLALVLAITGLVWSFAWFEDSLYFVTSGGKNKQEHSDPHSDVSKAGIQKQDATTSILNVAWYKMLAQEPHMQGIFMSPSFRNEDDAIEIIAYQDHGSFYDRHVYFFDRYTLAELPSTERSFSETGFADQLSMLNYDIHIGAAGGLPGKILAFFVSLICASLPITGFLVWWNKRDKKAKKEKKRLAKSVQATVAM